MDGLYASLLSPLRRIHKPDHGGVFEILPQQLKRAAG